MRRFQLLHLSLLTTIRTTATSIKQGTSTSDVPEVQALYNNLVYDETDGLVGSKVQPKAMSVPLLPFQQEGVAWMMQREQMHNGGILADHLGMGKTVQIIGLCCARCSPIRFRKLKWDPKTAIKQSIVKAKPTTKPQGHRVLTVLRQMGQLPVVGTCSRLTQPGADLHVLQSRCEELLKSDESNYASLVTDITPWLKFCGRHHPAFSRRSKAFISNDKIEPDAVDENTPELRTLIVVPASLMFQWKQEIETKIRNDFQTSLFVYHGGNKNISIGQLESADFVITTYDTLCAGLDHSVLESAMSGPRCHQRPEDQTALSTWFDRSKASPLFQLRWKRVVLDEAHLIRNHNTKRWQAVREILANKKWAVTATPLHNTIEDLQNVLRFVGAPKLPVAQGGGHSLQLLKDPVLQRSIARSLQPVLLRRGSVMYRNNQREVLVQLPTKSEKVKNCELNEKEVKIYNHILLKSKHNIDTRTMKGSNAAHIFGMMTRLRQICCHHWLAAGKVIEVFLCGICNSEASQAIKTPCGHCFCSECLQNYFREAEADAKEDGRIKVPCPVCSVMIPTSLTSQHHVTSAEHIRSLKKKTWESSSKLEMLLEEVRSFQVKYPDDKMVVFSQFTTFLDIIQLKFETDAIPFCRLDGSMPLTNRNAIIQQFHERSDVRVMLASKMASGVGLNLTCANHVIVLDPWWNPAIEEQAVHRVYRIGQKKDVHVQRFIVNSTIEQYCQEIAQKKKEFGDAVLKAATGNAAEKDQGKTSESRFHELVGKLHTIKPMDHLHQCA